MYLIIQVVIIVLLLIAGFFIFNSSKSADAKPSSKGKDSNYNPKVADALLAEEERL